MTITYVYPFSTEPTIEEMAGQNLLIVDVSDVVNDLLVHNMNIPPGLDPMVSMIALPGDGWSLPQVGFESQNDLRLISDRGGSGGGTYRLYIERIGRSV